MLHPSDFADRAGCIKARLNRTIVDPREGGLTVPGPLITAGKMVADTMEAQNLCEPGGKLVIALKPNRFWCEIIPPSPPPQEEQLGHSMPDFDEPEEPEEPKAKEPRLHPVFDSIPVLEPATQPANEAPQMAIVLRRSASAEAPRAISSSGSGSAEPLFRIAEDDVATLDYQPAQILEVLGDADTLDYQPHAATVDYLTPPAPTAARDHHTDSRITPYYTRNVLKLVRLTGLTSDQLNSRYSASEIRDICKFNCTSLLPTKQANISCLIAVIHA